MADQAPDDREAGLLDDDLDRVGDVREAVLPPCLLDAGGERLLADGQEPLCDGGDLPDRQRDRTVGDEAVEGDAEIDRDQIALLGAVLVRIPCTTIEFGEIQSAAGKPL